MRATGSGAGCGSHWPECNGQVVPFSGSTETAIEFTHRATSGLAFIGVVALWMWARRSYRPAHRVRLASGWAALFILVEVLIGAALVTYEWVGDDASGARAVVDGLHLVNTLFLLGALTLVAWWASGGAGFRLEGSQAPWLIVGLMAVALVAAAGALTALGDTLFPEATVADDFSSSSHFLVRLRMLHPVLAVVTGGYLLVVARRHLAGPASKFASALAVLVVVQLGAGIVNLALSAPLGMQVVHLLLADAVWVTLVLLTAASLAVRADEPVAA